MKNKKSELSINTVIVAALALAVLIVLIFIFTGNLGKVSDNIGSCTAKGGECAKDMDKNNEWICKEDRPIPLYVTKECETSKNLCCLRIGMQG